MIAKPKTQFYLLLSLAMFFSCTGKQPTDQKAEEHIHNDIDATDTLFGNLSAKQRYFQHLVLDIPETFQLNLDSLINWIVENEPGALKFSNWEQDSMIKVKRTLDTLPLIEPLYFTDFFDDLNLPHYPFWDANAENRSLKWMPTFQVQHVNIVNFQTNFLWTESARQWLNTWHDSSGTQFITHHFDDKNVKVDFERFNQAAQQHSTIIHLKLDAYDTVRLENLRTINSFDGLFQVKSKTNACNQLLAGGADLIEISLANSTLKSIPYESWQLTSENQAVYEESTQRILSLKRKRLNLPLAKSTTEHQAYLSSNYLKNATSVIALSKSLLPLKPKTTIYSTSKLSVNGLVRSENELRLRQSTLDSSALQKIALEKGTKVLIVPDTLSQDLVNQISKFSAEQKVIICFSNPEFYNTFKNAPNLIFYQNPIAASVTHTTLIQQLCGQLSADGNLITQNTTIKGQKHNKRKLARMPPEFCGISSDSLRQIDYAVQSALNGRAFPGCQVIVAKNGCIIYDKSFGYHTYNRQTSVTRDSKYDLASLTKVVSTTLMGMKLYELEAFGLNDSLSAYLPDSLKDHLQFPSTIRNTTFQELFIHKSGLPAGFPIINYLRYTSDEIGRFDKYYCDLPDSVYNIEVAENFYLEKAYEDSLWLRLNQIWLDPAKPYKYSDVNMNTLYFMFKSIIHKNPQKFNYDLSQKQLKEQARNLYVDYLYENFYKPLGMKNTCYKPRQKFNKNAIVPTENERFWRKQLLHGDVHDPNAALYGGIAGNAGIFSTANDLAILGEMLLRKGMYNGVRYLNAETIDQFTRAQPDSHRGLGWNKPSINTAAFGCASSASPLTYGHTGFTGTCIWMDPKEQLTYVFLSNRVHPTVNNRIYQHGVRGRAHQAVYDGRLY